MRSSEQEEERTTDERAADECAADEGAADEGAANARDAGACATAQPSQLRVCPCMMCVVDGCALQAVVCATPRSRRSAPLRSALPTS